MKFIGTIIIIMFSLEFSLLNLPLSLGETATKTFIINVPAAPDPENSRARHAKFNIKAHVKDIYIESDMTGEEKAYYSLHLFGYEIFTEDWSEGVNLKELSLGPLTIFLKNVGGLKGKPEVEVKIISENEPTLPDTWSAEAEAKAFVNDAGRAVCSINPPDYWYSEFYCYSYLEDFSSSSIYAYWKSNYGDTYSSFSDDFVNPFKLEAKFKYRYRELTSYINAWIIVTQPPTVTLIDYTRTVKVSVRSLDGDKLPITVELSNCADRDANGKPESNIIITGEGYANYIWRGSYTVKAPIEVSVNSANYVFDHWEFNGGISVQSRNDSKTLLTVIDDGSLTAIYRRKQNPIQIHKLNVYSFQISGVPVSWTSNILGSGSHTTPFQLEAKQPFTVKLNVPIKIQRNGRNYRFNKWKIKFNNGSTRTFTSNIIIVDVKVKVDATAIYVEENPPNPPSRIPYWQGYVEHLYERYRIINVKIDAAYTDVYGNHHGSSCNHLMPEEYYSIFIKIKVTHLSTKKIIYIAKYYWNGQWHNNPPINGLLTGYKRYKSEVDKYPVNGRIIIETPEWSNYVENFSEENGPKLSNRSVTVSFNSISKDGEHDLKVGSWLIKSNLLNHLNYTGKILTAKYSWTNTYGDGGSGEASCKIYVSRILPKLYWLPINEDQTLIIVAYNWISDGTPVKGRRYLAAKIGNIVLSGALFDDVKGLMKISKVKLDGKTAISFKVIGNGEIEQPKIKGEIPLKPQFKWSYDINVAYHELAIIIYGLEAKPPQLKVKAKLIDWTSMKPLNGWIMIKVRDLETDKTAIEIVEAEPNVEQTITTPMKHEVWMMGIAEGVNVIYGNLKYGKIMLDRNPPF